MCKKSINALYCLKLSQNTWKRIATDPHFNLCAFLRLFVSSSKYVFLNLCFVFRKRKWFFFRHEKCLLNVIRKNEIFLFYFFQVLTYFIFFHHHFENTFFQLIFQWSLKKFYDISFGLKSSINLKYAPNFLKNTETFLFLILYLFSFLFSIPLSSI